ncbi:MAG: hypothetical protein ACKV2T_27745 [Kofleriaceae bacterium]
MALFTLAVVGCAPQDPPVNWAAAPPPPFGYGAPAMVAAPAPPPPPFGYVAVESSPSITISATISTEPRTCLMGANGHQACGYDCMLSTGVAFCATQPGGSCLVDAWGTAYCR